ncbi:MAG TPA: tripartite tricarboxylate transporter TctB family protein [Aurantimonas sp.]
MLDRETRKPVGADLIIPVAAGAYAIYYVLSVWNFPWQAQMSGIILAALMLLLVGIYLVRVVIGLRRERYTLGFGDFFGAPSSRASRAIFVALIVGYILAVPYLGFTITTFVFLATSFLVAGARPVGRAVLTAGLAALGGWIFFIVLLNTRFPQGPFEQAMGAIF